MAKIQIKPLSVNGAWRGRRFKTSDYQAYEVNLGLLLPNNFIFPVGKFHLLLEFGVSSKMSDIDNPVKPFVDVLQKKYGFNDKMIYAMTIKKVDVEKGKEYICFDVA